ncbi:hypothetical protein ES702_00183 [subsurface metagenome]
MISSGYSSIPPVNIGLEVVSISCSVIRWYGNDQCLALTCCNTFHLLMNAPCQALRYPSVGRILLGWSGGMIGDIDIVSQRDQKRN